MTIQARHLGLRRLLILALAAALLGGIIAIHWAMGQRGFMHTIVTSSETHYMVTVPGGDTGGGHHRDTGVFTPAGAAGGDSGGGH